MLRFPTPRFLILITSLTLAGLFPCVSLAGAAEDGLLHWKFDEGSGNVAQDASGQGLNGDVKASQADSPVGADVDLLPKSISLKRRDSPLIFAVASRPQVQDYPGCCAV